MSVCTSVCLSQDRANLRKSYKVRPLCTVLWNTDWYSSHHFEKLTTLGSWPLWGVSLSLGMADGVSSNEDSPDDDSNLIRTRTASYRTQEAPSYRTQEAPSYRTQEAPSYRTQEAPSYRTQEAPRWWQRLGLYGYSYRTHEAQLKPDCGTVGRTICSRTTSAYSFLCFTCTFPYTSSAYCTYIHTFAYPFFVITHLSNS